MKFKAITAHKLHVCLDALETPPGLALRDPIHVMRYAASCGLDTLGRSLRAVVAEGCELDGDELRLLGAFAIYELLEPFWR